MINLINKRGKREKVSLMSKCVGCEWVIQRMATVWRSMRIHKNDEYGEYIGYGEYEYEYEYEFLSFHGHIYILVLYRVVNQSVYRT